MKNDGLENVRTERVMVPRWVRGVESAEIVEPPRHPIVMLGLGGTVATPPGGLEADVLVVSNFDDLRVKRAHVPGRIVLFDVAYTTYAETMSYRTGGARLAAEYGAAAVLVRSVGPIGLRTAHTGSVNYAPGQPQIPAAAIAVEDANRIARLATAGRRVRVRLVTSGHMEPDVASANVVAEITGRERPEEIVLLGGHLDSWDVGTGASDDGAGCIITWEALRLMKKLGLRPRRTVRLVLWTNEEHGMHGAAAYGAKYAHAAGNHVLAIESDSGVFAPASIGFSGSAAGRLVIAPDRDAARAARAAGDRRRRRRARHRSDRAGRQRARVGLSRRRLAAVSDPPHRRRHRRAHRARGTVEGGRGDCGDHLCRRGDAGADSEIEDRWDG